MPPPSRVEALSKRKSNVLASRRALRVGALASMLSVPIASPRLMAIAVTHGVVDIVDLVSVPFQLRPQAGAHLVPYNLLLLPPLPLALDTLAFFAASVVHFAADGGLTTASAAISMLMHIGVVVLRVANREATGAALVTAYLALCHTPLLLLRTIHAELRDHTLALVVTVLCSLLAPQRTLRLALGRRLSADGRNVRLDAKLQRVVWIHVLASFLRRPRI